MEDSIFNDCVSELGENNDMEFADSFAALRDSVRRLEELWQEIERLVKEIRAFKKLLYGRRNQMKRRKRRYVAYILVPGLRRFLPDYEEIEIPWKYFGVLYNFASSSRNFKTYFEDV